MKILMFERYCYKDGYNFSSNRTGFGYMVTDIAESLAQRGNEVGVLTSTFFTKGITLDGVKYLKHPKTSLFHFKIKDFFGEILKNGNHKLKNVFFSMNTNFYVKSIKKFKPDVVVINSMGEHEIPFLKACIRTKTKFVVVQHGFYMRDSVMKGDRNVYYEKAFAEYLTNNNIQFIVVSNGIRKDFLECYEKINGQNLVAIPNGVRRFDKTTDRNVLSEYKMPKFKTIISVGTVCERKNQESLVRAAAILKKRNVDVNLLLCGTDVLNGKIQKTAEDLNVGDRVRVTGFISRSQIGDFYKAADAVALISISEGFGMSVAEGLVLGKPVLISRSMNIVKDTDLSEAGILVDEKDDNSVADGIEKILSMKFDPESVKETGKPFSPEILAERYEHALERQLTLDFTCDEKAVKLIEREGGKYGRV